MLALQPDVATGFRRAVGIGGIGAGIVFALDGNQTLGRNESRLGRLLDARDYCKLHIVGHYIAAMMGAHQDGEHFHVVPVGVVGHDDTGSRITREMAEVGLDARFVRHDPQLKTLFSVCFVYPDSSGGNITTSNSAAAALSAEDLHAAAALLKDAGARGIALCLPEVPLDVRRRFLSLATECGSYRAASFALGDIGAARDKGLFSLIDLLAINKEEASALVGRHYEREQGDSFLADLASVLTAAQPCMRIVVSAGPEGAYAFENGAWDYCPAPQVQVVSTAGAGDALLAGVLSALSAGIPFVSSGGRRRTFSERPLRSALEFGVLLASFTVTSPHTIHPAANFDSLRQFAGSLGVALSHELLEKIADTAQQVAVTGKMTG
jgi:sugar/nucleoside kinase (ribokinase family)